MLVELVTDVLTLDGCYFLKSHSFILYNYMLVTDR